MRVGPQSFDQIIRQPGSWAAIGRMQIFRLRAALFDFGRERFGCFVSDLRWLAGNSCLVQEHALWINYLT